MACIRTLRRLQLRRAQPVRSEETLPTPVGRGSVDNWSARQHRLRCFDPQTGILSEMIPITMSGFINCHAEPLCSAAGSAALGQMNRAMLVYWQNSQVTRSWLGTKIAI